MVLSYSCILIKTEVIMAEDGISLEEEVTIKIIKNEDKDEERET